MWLFFFFKQKTAYEMRISDWSSDVCSSDLIESAQEFHAAHHRHVPVEQDHVGPVGTAEGQCLLPIGGLLDRKGHALQYMARDLADDLAVIDDQTGFRHIVPPTPPGFASSYGKGVCSPLIRDKIHAALATGRVTNSAGSTTSSEPTRCSIIASAPGPTPGG